MKLRRGIAGCILVSLTVLACLYGCGIGTPAEKKLSYDDVFIDRHQEDKQDGAWKGSMIEYKYSLPGYGEMSIYVDTTEGHTFELIEGTSAFQVKDKDGNLAVTGLVMDKDQYKSITAYANDNYTINGRKFCGLINEYNSIDIYSYMADCGIDGGMCIEATDESLFKLVAFRGTPIEGALDQDAYKGKIEDVDTTVSTQEVEPDIDVTVDVQSLFDEDTMGFADGYVFNLSEVKIEEHNGYYFKIKDSESVIETAITSDYTAADAAQTMADSLKAASGETPVVDIHDEGVYITGLYENAFMLCFLADGVDTTYIMSMRTADADNSIKIFNSVISDFLAGGATDYSVRTEYGKPVDGGEDEKPVDDPVGEPLSATPKEGTYFNAPKGYECTYACEFFDTYSNDKYEYQFNYLEDEDLVAFAKGKNDEYLGQKINKVAEVKSSSNGKVIIGERTNGEGYYRYHAVSEDGVINIEFNSYYSEQLDKTTCEKLIKDVLK